MPGMFQTTPISLFFPIVSLVVTLILGALAWSRVSSSFLPLPSWLPVLATLLSPLTAAALAVSNTSSRNAANAPNLLWTRIASIVDQLHSVLLSAIASVALAYLFPDNILTCHLEQQWQAFFQSKNAHAIRTIQDTNQCCGLRSVHDRAWPFKDRDHGDEACETQLGYHRSCLTPWRAQQQNASWMIFAAAALIWAIKIGFVQFGDRRPSWMSTASSRNNSEYRRITQPELRDAEENNNDAERGTGINGTFSPHAGHNVWEER
ncbi:uncharacterized protein EURHEDRAFT_410812 [Aspergillus ruber CBS 135680]|uniref:Tetraspanin Tsp3 n=1 Tax=Aspergillus ruber (strain CBS 135680) TaxID=1388766 RepID=A0A017SJB8_ASPRC|nr:uncharacterized protein EURHEDRAFT_410812 [Aspergillus ruber CBS 135680]EYE97012.1 hypothetical protein EURHEDRAFT_410812 [Aspergillus ruber CBS 135680]